MEHRLPRHPGLTLGLPPARGSSSSMAFTDASWMSLGSRFADFHVVNSVINKKWENLVINNTHLGMVLLTQAFLVILRIVHDLVYYVYWQ
jgi:hypothetical protein